MSRIDSQNLPFYMHDYDEQKCNFITFRLKGNLDYSSIISCKNLIMPSEIKK